MLRTQIKLLAFFDDAVLKPDSRDCLVARIGFHACLTCAIELGEDGRGEESCSEFIECLLLCMFLNDGNIFCQVDKRTCLSTVVNNKSTIIIRKATECLN